MMIQELKKMFSARKVLLFAGFAVLFYLMFLRQFVQVNPGSYHDELDMARSFVKEFGTEVTGEEFEKLKAMRPVYENSKLDDFIAGSADFAAYGIHSFRELLAACDGVSLTLDEENYLMYKLYEGATGEEVGDEMARQMMLNVWEDYIKDYEYETAGNGTALYENLSGAQAKRVAERNRKEVYGILPSAVVYKNFEVLRFFPVFMMLSVIFWVMPYMVSENRSRMPILQYSAKKGRKYYYCRLAAALLSTLLLLAVEVGVYCLIAKINRVFDFWDSGMSSFSSNFICWFPWTLGEYTAVYLGIITAFSLGLSMAVFVVTGYLNNYINAIAWQLPLAVGACFFGGAVMFRFGEITLPPYLAPFLAAAVLAAGIAAVAVQAAAERRRNMLS